MNHPFFNAPPPPTDKRGFNLIAVWVFKAVARGFFGVWRGVNMFLLFIVIFFDDYGWLEYLNIRLFKYYYHLR